MLEYFSSLRTSTSISFSFFTSRLYPYEAKQLKDHGVCICYAILAASSFPLFKNLWLGKLCGDVLWKKSFYNQMCCKHYYWCPPKSLSEPVVLVFNYFWLQWHLQGRHSLGFCSSGVRCLKEMDRSSPVFSSLFQFHLPNSFIDFLVLVSYLISGHVHSIFWTLLTSVPP